MSTRHRDLPWGEGKYTFANGNVCKGGIYHKDGSSSGHVTRADGTGYYGRWDKDGIAL